MQISKSVLTFKLKACAKLDCRRDPIWYARQTCTNQTHVRVSGLPRLYRVPSWTIKVFGLIIWGLFCNLTRPLNVGINDFLFLDMIVSLIHFAYLSGRTKYEKKNETQRYYEKVLSPHHIAKSNGNGQITYTGVSRVDRTILISMLTAPLGISRQFWPILHRFHRVPPWCLPQWVTPICDSLANCTCGLNGKSL